MPQTTTQMDTSALNPTIWANMMQVPLRKSLVAEAVADVQFEPLLAYGDKVNQPYIDETSVETYTPGQPFEAKGTTATQDTLTVDQFKIVPNYVDDVNELQSKYRYSMDLIDNQAYQLRDDIDTAVLRHVTGAGNFLYAPSAEAGGDIRKSDDLSNVSASTQRIKVQNADSDTSGVSPIELFSRVRRELRVQNVEEAGDWIAVVKPDIAQIIEMLGADKGFSVADATLRNGWAGSFLGFNIYISNNLPNHWAYFGKSRRIALVVQMPPRVRIKDVPNKLGVNIVTSIVYGTKVFTKNAQRYLGVHYTL